MHHSQVPWPMAAGPSSCFLVHPRMHARAAAPHVVLKASSGCLKKCWQHGLHHHAYSSPPHPCAHNLTVQATKQHLYDRADIAALGQLPPRTSPPASGWCQNPAHNLGLSHRPICILSHVLHKYGARVDTKQLQLLHTATTGMSQGSPC
jgi:hypothetical protein